MTRRLSGCSASVMFHCPLVARTPWGHGGQAAHAGTLPLRNVPTQQPPPTPRRLPVLSAGPVASTPYGNPARAPPPSPRGHTGSRGTAITPRGSLCSGSPPGRAGTTPPPGGGMAPPHGLRGTLAVVPVPGLALVCAASRCAVTHAPVTAKDAAAQRHLPGGHSVTVRGYGLYDGHFNT